MLILKILKELRMAWEEAPRGWRWLLFALLFIPILIVIAVNVFKTHAVVAPTEKADERSRSEAKRVRQEENKIDQKRREDLKETKDEYGADEITKRHKLVRNLDAAEKSPDDLVKKMKKVGRGEPLAVLLLLFVTVQAKAELHLEPWVYAIGSEMAPAELYGEDKIVHIREADVAPYEGVLLDIPTAARWTYRLDWYQKQLKVDSDTLRRVFAIEYAALEKKCATTSESKEREIAGLRRDITEQAKKMTKVPFWRKASFGLVLGVVVGVVVGAVSYKIAD